VKDATRIDPSQNGFSLVELLIGMVVSSIVLAGAFTLWNTHQQEGFRIGKKITVRNEMTLSSKRIQRSVTLAGLGLNGAANLAKEDAVGSDTLIIFTNQAETHSALVTDFIHGGPPALMVAEPSVFAGYRYVAVKTGNLGEIRRILSSNSSILLLDSPFGIDHPAATSVAYPAQRERYYSNQESQSLMHEGREGVIVVARDVTNFQVSFRNKRGEATEVANEVRTVLFSFTGVYPAKEGALNSIVFSSTAIPRNAL
jgi:prepilin-type N-terminal cleavage/methylation domain-containing protein